MGSDPFATLGLTAEASADEVRAARRRLALEHHPDLGGDPGAMRAVNEAAAAALRQVARPRDGGPRPGPALAPEAARTGADRGERWSGVTRDIPSFTVEALPVHAFEALIIAATALGEVLDDDPPYRLDTALGPPLSCWCRLEVLPDAGSSTVTLTVGSVDGRPAPAVETVRDAWIAELNSLDWENLQPG